MTTTFNTGEPDATDSDALRPGTVVGHWQVEHELGRGGMGTVYAVRHTTIGKSAALKVVHREVLTGGGYPAAAMLIEARAVNAFSHPNVVDIFESGTMDDGRTFLVMERLHGQTLGERQAASRIPALEVIDYLIPLCDALAAAHNAGIVHRDIKLDNVFLAETPGAAAGVMVKLLDWGVASITAGPGGRSGDRLTIGTPRYVAPEQIRGEGVTAASDIYALGVVAYELFLEESPFDAPTTSELLLAHVNDPPPPPRDTWPRIPTALEDVLLAMLRKDPLERPTAECVAAVLTEVRNELRNASRELTPIIPRALMRSAPRTPSGPREFGVGREPTMSAALAARTRAPWHWLIPVALIVSGLGLRTMISSKSGVRVVEAATVASATTAAAPTAVAPPTLISYEAPTPVPSAAERSPMTTARRAIATTRATGRTSNAADRQARLRPDDLIEPY